MRKKNEEKETLTQLKMIRNLQEKFFVKKNNIRNQKSYDKTKLCLQSSYLSEN